MYFVYILYSEKCDRYYIGYSENSEARLDRHDREMLPPLKTADLTSLKHAKNSQLKLMYEEKNCV